MLKKLANRIVIWDIAILVVAAILVLVKIPYLNLPYFWDEAWVYASAVFDMHKNGPSLSPNSVNPDLSRGHPLLFHFLANCWITVFGSSFTVVHTFSVFMTVLLILATYRLGTHLFNPFIGFWIAALVALQPIVLQQSGFLLPEVQLALFTILSIHYYLKKQHWQYIIAATALLLTKETGVILIGCIALLETVQFLIERKWNVKRIGEFLSVGAPILLMGLYFTVQYSQFGWFMFPEHVSMFETDPEIWMKRREITFKILFANQQRSLLLWIGLFCVSLGWEKGPKLLRAMLFIVALTFATMTGLKSWLPNWYYLYAFPCILMVATVLLGQSFSKPGTKNHLFYPLVGMVIAITLPFTASHFIIDRYFIFLIPLLFLVSGGMVFISLKKTPWLLCTSVISLSLVFFHFSYKADGEITAHNNLQYVGQIRVMEKGIDFLETSVGHDSCIAATYILRQAMRNPVQGYLSSEATFSCLNGEILPEINYVMTISFDDGGLKKVENDPLFQQLWETHEGSFRSRVFVRK